MVGSLQSPNPKKEEKESSNNLSFSLLGLEDLSFSCVDSFLDFDYIKDWIEENPEPYSKSMASDLGEGLAGFSSEKVAFEVFDKSVETGSAGFVGEEGGELGSLGQEKVELVRGEKDSEMGSQRFCEKIEVEEGIDGVDGMKLGGLGCSIEEEMGKVSLEGGLSDPDSVFDGLTAIKQSGEGCDNGNGENDCGSDVVKSVEANTSGTGGKESGVENFGAKTTKISEKMNVDNTGEKGGKNESDGDETDSNSDSEGESDSEIESSSSSSSSSSSESSDDDDDDNEGEGKKEWGNCKERKGQETDMEEGEIVASDPEEMVTWSSNDEYDEDETGSGISTLGPLRSKNELTVLPPVPLVNVTLQPHHKIQPVGVVLSVLGAQVIVEGVEKHNPLNEGSILWISESRSALGLVDEIFGPVRNPYYIVRFNSENEIPAGIQSGTSISFVPEFANHVLNDKSLYSKGYDASGANDEELLEEDEFSDDEKEAEYRKMQKNKKRGTNDNKIGNVKKDEKRSGNWSRNSKYDSTVNRHLPMKGAKRQVDHSKHHVPAAVVPQHQGNRLHSLSLGQGSTSQPGLAAPFVQLASTTGFSFLSGGANGIPFQQPQTVGLPGLPTNGMPTVRNPYYGGMCDSETEVPAGSQLGTSLSFVPQFKNHGLKGKSASERGYDASGVNNDVFIGEKISDYEEAEYGKTLKNENRRKNDVNFDNQKMGRLQLGNWSGNSRKVPAANPEGSLERGKLPFDYTKHHVPPLAPPLDQGNGSFSGLGQGLAFQPGLGPPPFVQLSLGSGFGAASGGANAIPFQQPLSFGFPQLPADVIPWVQQINQLHQMPSQNILSFQQQINANPNLPSNLVISGSQSGLGSEPAFSSQNTSDHSPFGVTTPGQQASLPIYVGEQADPANLSERRHNYESQQLASFTGKRDTYRSFSHGKHYRGGRKPNRRSGGQFGGGRWRQQHG